MTSNTHEKTMAGMSPQEYDSKGTEYSRDVIATWILSGLIYNLIKHKLISIQSILLIMPGTFIVSFAAIPPFILSKKGGAFNQFIFGFIFRFIVPIFEAILAMYLIRTI